VAHLLWYSSRHFLAVEEFLRHVEAMIHDGAIAHNISLREQVDLPQKNGSILHLEPGLSECGDLPEIGIQVLGNQQISTYEKYTGRRIKARQLASGGLLASIGQSFGKGCFNTLERYEVYINSGEDIST